LPGGQQGQQPPTKPSPAQRGQQQQFQKPSPQQTPQPGIGQNSPTPSYQPAGFFIMIFLKEFFKLSA